MKVLVVVDYQKDFVDGALGFASAKDIDNGIAQLVKETMNEDGVVIFTADTHYSEYLDTQEGKLLPVPHCIHDTEGWQLYGETGKVFNTDFEKGSMFLLEKDTFGSTSLMTKLRQLNVNDGKFNGVESITLVGVVTNMCVISNAVIAKTACPEAKIIIKKDLVDSFDKELHQKALDVMASMQMTVE